MIWVISDLHFNHAKLIENKIRPANYEKKIIRSWNRQAKDDDIIIILGDLSWTSDLSFLEKLKGRKILVRGNHDYKTCETYMKYFDFACDKFSMQYRGKNIVFSHCPLKEFDEDINIHGHLHNSHNKRFKEFNLTYRHYLVSLELQGYRLFSLNEILKRSN